MSPGTHTEQGFQDRVEHALLQRGWETATGSYDAELGIDTGALLKFIVNTQVEPWSKLLDLYGGAQDATVRQFALHVASEIDSRGVLDVLRHGVKDRGVQIDLAYFRPELALAADMPKGYNANVLGVARQLRFSHRDPGQSIDLALFVNGLPVATIELKSSDTGQDTGHAIAQYRQRDPDDLFFARRTLAHFAVDPNLAFITTRLKGQNTQFIPFNVGSNGPGREGGTGNPPPVHGNDYSVSYLWNDIWQRDNWLEILQRFMHDDAEIAINGEANPHTATAIFPRFHQWHAVHQMIAHARENGTGSNYLIHHSTGSGVYRTIAWLAYGLSTLSDNDSKPVFDKVVVITDRVVLDQQLQWTILQLGQAPGFVKGVYENSAQLTETLKNTTSKIVISTLQKYSFAMEEIAGAGLTGQRYAVILHDAHYSQSGISAARMRQALETNTVIDEDEDENEASYFTQIREPQPNISYFAFTATPTPRTLELFGIWDPSAVNPRSPGERGMYVPFHVYSMRQAIEEGFILDVLANYIAYDTTWRLWSSSIEQAESSWLERTSPEADERKAKIELARFVEQSPQAVTQKAKVIIEDFRDRIARRLGGRAKAMVVCKSRNQALAMFRALREVDRTLPDCGFGVLIAFSGSLPDQATGLEVTESQLNGFPESQVPNRFRYVKADDPAAAVLRQEEYRILVVVDKYTTGFDQPLLCGMYVDRPLRGAAAVQTLSRLNRIHPLKTQDDVHIVDFVNSAADIQEAFRPWFETKITEPTDPNLLYAKKSEVWGYGLLSTSEMKSFTRMLDAGHAPLEPAEQALDAQMHSYLQPALDRFAALETDEQLSFQEALQVFVRSYNLLAQVADRKDSDLDRLYKYGQVLLILLAGQPTASVDARHADRADKLAEEADEIRALAAAGDYRQAEIRLARLAAENPQLTGPLRLELGFITLPDPDRQIVATAWSAISMGRAVRFLPTKDVSSTDGPAKTANSEIPQAVEAASPVQPQVPAVSAPRRSPQHSGAVLEQATIDLFAQFFTVEPDTILDRLRRQRAGTQFGHDIEAEWTVAGSPAVRCHVECKNLDRRVTVDDIAGKLAQQKYHHRGIQIDHWILISPHHDGANELPGMLEEWNQQGEYPFSIQIWSPENRVREMFALEPAVYEAVYGRPPTQEEVDASSEVSDIIRQRLAPKLRVDAVWRRYLEQPGAFCFVNEDSRHFDELYIRHLPLRAADDRGALLDGTLMDQVTEWASDNAAEPMLLIADFGEGKSVFTYCLMRQLSERFRTAPDGALFPLRIPLREFREAGTARGLLERRLAEIGATLADWRTLTKQVRTLVILDGFDEMSADLSPAAITANLRDIRSCLTEFSGSKVLVTSRQRVLDGSRDWKRTLDRLGQPQIMRIASGPRRQRLRYLEQFATDATSAQVLASLHGLYDPIGLAAKPLFLEMIKETLRELPGDTFSEMILYETYINKSLRTKWELLADPDEELTSNELIENLKEILEDVAVRLQETNSAYLYLRDYQDNDRGKIAERLWEMRDQPVPREPFLLTAQDDATNRVGIRSLLKAVSAPNAQRWPVDFFHRSMREYFVARSIDRSLATDEKRSRQILSAAPLLPEITHFAAKILRSHQNEAALAVLEKLARSATIDGDSTYLGGNAFTLLHSAGGLLAGRDWSGLRLDYARLRGVNLEGARFIGSSLRYANLDNANLEGTDLTNADLEGVRLEETSQVLAVTALNGNRVIAAYEDRSLRKWHRQPGGDWESQIVASLDHKADQLQITAMGRVLVSGEGMLSVLDIADDIGFRDSAKAYGSIRTHEASVIHCAFRTNSKCRAAVLGTRHTLFAEEKDNGQLRVTWLDRTKARILNELDVDETVTAWTQLDGVLFAFAVPEKIYVVPLLGNDGGKLITVADPAVTCLSVRAAGDYVLLAAGHHDGSVGLTRLDPVDTGVVVPQSTLHLHDGPVTSIFLDTEDQVITGSTDRTLCVTPVSVIQSNSPTSDGAESAVQRLHLTLRCRGVRFDGVRTEHEREKLRRYAEY